MMTAAGTQGMISSDDCTGQQENKQLKISKAVERGG